MDYIDFCKKYYATTKIPISLLLGTAGKYSTIGELFSVEPLTDYPVLAGGPNPSIHFYTIHRTDNPKQNLYCITGRERKT